MLVEKIIENILLIYEDDKLLFKKDDKIATYNKGKDNCNEKKKCYIHKSFNKPSNR